MFFFNFKHQGSVIKKYLYQPPQCKDYFVTTKHECFQSNNSQVFKFWTENLRIASSVFLFSLLFPVLPCFASVYQQDMPRIHPGNPVIFCSCRLFVGSTPQMLVRCTPNGPEAILRNRENQKNRFWTKTMIFLRQGTLYNHSKLRTIILLVLFFWWLFFCGFEEPMGFIATIW